MVAYKINLLAVKLNIPMFCYRRSDHVQLRYITPEGVHAASLQTSIVYLRALEAGERRIFSVWRRAVEKVAKRAAKAARLLAEQAAVPATERPT